MIYTIDQPDDARLAPYRNLTDGELLRRSGLFMAEGRYVVRMLLASELYRPESVLVTEAALESLRDILLTASPPPVPVYVVPRAILDDIAGFEVHRGCLAAGRRPPASSPARVLGQIAPGAAAVVVLEDLLNHDNVGGVFRNAAAFGSASVLLSPGCVDPLYRKAIRVSMGAVLRIPCARFEPEGWPAGLDALRSAGFRIVALTPRPSAMDLGSFAGSLSPGARIALLLGSEGPGLSAAALERADHLVRIPISSRVDSLNVATACGIALHALGLHSGDGA